MFKKLEKSHGMQKATIYYDKALKSPYLVVIGNNTFIEANTFASAEDVLSNIINVELKHKFSLEEITDIKSYSKIDEKTNAEVFAKWGIKAHGGSRNNAGRKVGSLQKTPKTDRTERFTMAITKEEKEFLIQSLKEYRKKHNK
jgi:hypothetical protein